MSNVISLSSAPVEDNKLGRLRGLSSALAVLFQILLGLAIAWAIAAVVVTLFFAANVQVGPEGAYLTYPAAHDIPGTVLLSEQSPVIRIAGVIDVLIATTPIAFGLYHLAGLFRLYASGTVFARSNALHLRQIGIWLLAYPFAKFGANMIFQGLGGTDRAWFSSSLVYALLLGAVVLVMTHVMELGHELENERAEFV